MKKAWVEIGIIRDVCPGDPAALYHPDVAALYTEDVPDEAAKGDAWDGAVLTPPAPTVVTPTAPPPPEPPKLSPVQFKMCFTPQERITIKALRATNQIIDDAYEILDDPRLTTVDMALASNQQMIDYLVSLAALTPERAAQIKAGIML